MRSVWSSPGAGRPDAQKLAFACAIRLNIDRHRQLRCISFHPSTRARCSSVSGERLRPSGVPRRRSAIRVSASPPSRASCSTSQQPITVPVRPIPPQQCTVRRGAGRNIHLELGKKRLKISGPRHPQVGYWHPLVRDRYSSVTGELSEHVVIRQQFAFLGQVEEGADARVEQGVEFATRPRCAHSAGVLSSEQQPIDDPVRVRNRSVHCFSSLPFNTARRILQISRVERLPRSVGPEHFVRAKLALVFH